MTRPRAAGVVDAARATPMATPAVPPTAPRTSTIASNADHQGYCDADGAPDEGRTIPPQLSHETAEERSNPDRAVVRRRVPREGVPGPANPTHVGVAP